MHFSKFGAVLTWAVGVVHAASSFTPARPPAIPLAVKSPYLNSWLFAGSDGGNGGYLAGQWSQHWAQTVTAMEGLIRVDGKVYQFLGNAGLGTTNTNQTAFTYSATRSIFTQTAGPVQIKTTFLSPLTPTDFKRASLVASYVQHEVVSLDGKNHSVQLYSDVSGEWASGATNSTINWNYASNGKVAYHSFGRTNPLLFSEINQKAEWGTWYWSSDNVQGTTYQSGADVNVRGAFIKNGKLANTKDTQFRPIEQNWPVFAFSHDFGQVSKTPVSRLFTIGLYQTQAIQFLGSGSNVQSVPSLWTSYFSKATDGVNFFHTDYSTVSQMTTTFDNKVASDSKNAGGSNYVTITTLAARQVFAAIQLTGNSTKQYAFLKEISSDGNIQTVDIIYPAMPVFLYTNPTLVKLLLDPLFENQEAGHYPNKYSMHDLGSSYPNATGHPDGNDEYMPLEECGNMLVLTLAYAQRAKDTAFLKQHYKLLKQWTTYLVQEALYPANQISTDDFAGALPNQTNLAIKGMIGIAAMGQIANLTGNTADFKNYTQTATNYVSTWSKLAVNNNTSPAHTVLNYNNASTWGTVYNIYADKLLKLNVVPQSIYTIAQNFYPTKINKYGLPLDSRDNLAKGDWEMFIAAAVGGNLRTKLINAVANWINVTPINLPLTDLYDTISGNWPDDNTYFYARPAVGGLFALLAL